MSSRGLSFTCAGRRPRRTTRSSRVRQRDARRRFGTLQEPAAIAVLSGNATLSNATLPFASFIKAASGGGGPGPRPDSPRLRRCNASAGKNVRVRGSGYGAGLRYRRNRVGSVWRARWRRRRWQASSNRPAARLPTLTAPFASNRRGSLQCCGRRASHAPRGRNHQHRQSGSRSRTQPVRQRRGDGNGRRADRKLEDRPAIEPAGYSRDQILALIAPFGGFVSGIAYSSQSALARQQPGGITPLGHRLADPQRHTAAEQQHHRRPRSVQYRQRAVYRWFACPVRKHARAEPRVSPASTSP